MKLYNTLGRTIQEVKPLKRGEIKLYTCGPTVYHYYHIGNLRKSLFDDTLKRTLMLNNFAVQHVMNITDVGHLTNDADEGDDKLQSRADEEGKTVWEVAKFYTKAFTQDMAALNVLAPSKLVPATQAIKQQVAMVQALLDKGFAYQVEQAIYFDVSKLKDYGKLTGQKLDQKEVAARQDVVTDPDKKNPQDFALWFFTVGRFKDHQMHWPSPWGEGFPGWHLECSAIIEQELGDTIDIHTGGVDHIGTHHTNEIAQSEAAHDGKPLANLWLHSEFLLVNDKKMSKSLKNTYTLEDVVKKGFHPLDLRLFYLQAHYRTQQNFTWEVLEAAQNRRQSINAWADLRHQAEADERGQQLLIAATNEMQKALANDLDTPRVLAVLSDVINAGVAPTKDFLEYLDAALGLQLLDRADITKRQKELITKREKARASKDFKESDKLRDELLKDGIELNDTPRGTRWSRNAG
ncbi:cysteine--tRNA ligase [Patescibacteria group bacterium]|nr:MAG: cysteine--tRNA ligase [Patescibacteria group bacterium]